MSILIQLRPLIVRNCRQFSTLLSNNNACKSLSPSINLLPSQLSCSFKAPRLLQLPQTPLVNQLKSIYETNLIKIWYPSHSEDPRLTNRLANKEEWKEQKTLYKIHKKGKWLKKKRIHPLDSRPQMKGVVLKTLIKKPKKPNSANRRCVLVKLTNGTEKIAHVPGVGHNLQEHSVVIVERRRTKDVPGLKLKVRRGMLDCAQLPYKEKLWQKNMKKDWRYYFKKNNLSGQNALR